MPKTVIHTFNARSNALLQIVRADGSFSLQAMRVKFKLLTRTVAILASKVSNIAILTTPSHRSSTVEKSRSFSIPAI